MPSSRGWERPGRGKQCSVFSGLLLHVYGRSSVLGIFWSFSPHGAYSFPTEGAVIYIVVEF